MSSLENLTLFGIIGPIKDVTYVVKRELVYHWMFGPVMRLRKPVVVGRINPRDDFSIIMEEGSRTLNDGQSVIIFPQSTRRSYFDPADFNSVGIKLAQKAGVEIIPFAVKTDWWGNSRISSYFGKINQSEPIFIRFGEPIRVKGNGREAHRAVIQFIELCQVEWKHTPR
jgi:1-acyl-sn-glycerol-3-phosphate acyltransferase